MSSIEGWAAAHKRVVFLYEDILTAQDFTRRAAEDGLAVLAVPMRRDACARLRSATFHALVLDGPALSSGDRGALYALHAAAPEIPLVVLGSTVHEAAIQEIAYAAFEVIAPPCAWVQVAVALHRAVRLGLLVEELAQARRTLRQIEG